MTNHVLGLAEYSGRLKVTPGERLGVQISAKVDIPASYIRSTARPAVERSRTGQGAPENPTLASPFRLLLRPGWRPRR